LYFRGSHGWIATANLAAAGFEANSATIKDYWRRQPENVASAAVAAVDNYATANISKPDTGILDTLARRRRWWPSHRWITTASLAAALEANSGAITIQAWQGRQPETVANAAVAAIDNFTTAKAIDNFTTAKTWKSDTGILDTLGWWPRLEF
jgi:hypothetical protein